MRSENASFAGKVAFKGGPRVRMFWFWLVGRLDDELQKAGVQKTPQG
jgi:hypothetical protein